MSFPMSELGNIPLPEGFVLKEDGNFFQLSFKGEPITTFSSFGATPDEKKKEILESAEEHLRKIKAERR